MTMFPTTFARALGVLALAASIPGCGSGSRSSSPTGSSGLATTATPTPAPTVAPTPAATPSPIPTPTPGLTCGFTLSAATFEPQRLNCPGGETTQTMRMVFDLSAGGDLPITINRVSISGARCQPSSGTCNWPDGPLSHSPSVVQNGSRAQIVATQRFTCGSNGNPRSGAQLFVDKLFVNTSCGAARETGVTNTFTIGN